MYMAEMWGKQSCAPLWWDEPERTREEERRKVATVCLVHTGQRLLGITAHHVHRQLAARLEAGLTDWCQLGAHVFKPIERLIDGDQTIDLATYELSEIVLGGIGRHAYRAPSWPPPVPKQGTLGFVGGYPFELSSDIERGESGHPERQHKFLHFFTQFDECDNSSIGARVNLERTQAWTRDALPEGTLLDGMSGGPVLHFPDVGSLTTIGLAGIVFGHFFSTIQARPLSLVAPDGTLIRARQR
jgi:hypothetical protein